jgi:hypothetical protein
MLRIHSLLLLLRLLVPLLVVLSRRTLLRLRGVNWLLWRVARSWSRRFLVVDIVLLAAKTHVLYFFSSGWMTTS